jgi:hypothetical protein
MVHAGAVFECAKGVFNQCATFFHNAWLLFHPLFVTLDDGFMFPALDLPNGGFFAQTLLTVRTLASIRNLALVAHQPFAVFWVRFAAGGQWIPLWANITVLFRVIMELSARKTPLCGDGF